jgi:hypothetical protein
MSIAETCARSHVRADIVEQMDLVSKGKRCR